MILILTKTDLPTSKRFRLVKLSAIFACLSVILTLVVSARAEELTEQSLMLAATELAKQYDTYYGAKDVDGMTKVYAADAILISPSGAIVRGTEGLRPYYQKRFASGARDHTSTITEIHVQGNGGYGNGHFAVTVPGPDGKDLREQGNLAAVYQHEADGWHIKLLMPSRFSRKIIGEVL